MIAERIEKIIHLNLLSPPSSPIFMPKNPSRIANARRATITIANREKKIAKKLCGTNVYIPPINMKDIAREIIAFTDLLSPNTSVFIKIP